MSQHNLPELPKAVGVLAARRLDPPGTTEFYGYFNEGFGSEYKEPIYTADQMHAYALAALSEQGAGEAVALSEAESALDKLDQWLLDRCPGGPWVALEPLGVIREYIKASRLQASLPTDLVPLRIEYEPGYPEDVAFGTQMQMDRLKKWLDKFFALRLAEKEREETLSAWPREACPLTQAIQRLNSNPYSLTKDECIEVLRALRAELSAPPAAPTLFNGLTQAETDASASVNGLTAAPTTSPQADHSPDGGNMVEQQAGEVTELETMLGEAFSELDEVLRESMKTGGWVPSPLHQSFILAMAGCSKALAAIAAKKAGA